MSKFGRDVPNQWLICTQVAKITVVFDLVSRRFNACEAALRARGLAAAADCCRRVQTLEKEKLELTAATHLAAVRPDSDAGRAHVAARARRRRGHHRGLRRPQVRARRGGVNRLSVAEPNPLRRMGAARRLWRRRSGRGEAVDAKPSPL